MRVKLKYTEIVFMYGVDELAFTTKSVINKRNISQTTDQMVLLNKYLKYKGDDFNSSLWSKLVKAHDAIEGTVLSDHFVTLPEIMDIIEVIDIMDIYNFVKNIYKLKPPSTLLDEFTEQDEREGRLYREQTFIKNEYLELAALAVALKIIVGPISYFLYINAQLAGSNLEYSGFTYLRKSKLFRSPPMEKTIGLIGKLLEQNNTQVSIIEKQLPSSELPIYILSKVLFQRLSTATITDDTNERNLVTIVYSYASSKLNNTGDVTRVIRNKNTNMGGGDDDTTSSVVEAYKAVTDLTPGKIVEINWAMESIENVIHNSSDFIKSKVKIEDAKRAYRKLEAFRETDIPMETENMLAIILKDTIPPKAKGNLTIDSFLNGLAVAYVLLKNIDLPELATLLTSKTVTSEGIAINTAVNRVRLTTTDKENLNIYFPTRKINSTQSINVGEEWINATSSSYLEHKWYSIIDDVASSSILPNNLKPLLANLLITIEENRDAR